MTWGCLASLQFCALPTELSAGIEAFCLIDLFGEATLYGQFMLDHNSVPACYALVVFFWVILHAFWYPMIFFPEEWFFWWHEFELSTYGFLLSIRTFGLQNGLSPAIYAFALGIFVGWIEVVCPNIFSAWFRQKSWSAVWVAVNLKFFSGFSAAYCFFNTKEKTSADPVSNQVPKDVFLYDSPPLYQLRYRQVNSCSVW